MSVELDPTVALGESVPVIRRIASSRGAQMIVLALAVGALAWTWAGGEGGAEMVRQRFGLWAAAVLVLLQASITVTPFPDEVIGFANAMAYGFALGALFNWIGWMIGSFIEYVVARRTACDFGILPETTSPRLQWLLRRFPPGHPIFLILARQVPLAGHVVNSWAGIFRVPLWRFAWTAALGHIPGSLAISALANGLVSWLG